MVNAGDEVEVQVDCQANLLNGAEIGFEISHDEGGLPLALVDFTLSQDVVDTTITLTIRPQEKGIQAFTVEANCTMHELTQANNTASFFMQVKMVDKIYCFVQQALILIFVPYIRYYLSIRQ